MSILVSIIIPTFNRREDLKNCLSSVFALDYPNKEIIVVDDASDDGTEEMVKNNFPGVLYIRKGTRTGVGSKNLGIKNSSGQYLWFLDSDSFVNDKKCLTNMVEIMESDKSIGSIGGEVIDRDGEKFLRILRFLHNENSWPLDGLIKKNFKLQEVDYLPTCNCFTRKELVNKINGFNEDYFYVGEDAELGKKIKDLQYKNIVDYRTLVEHRRSNISRTANYKLFHKNKMKFVIRNFGIGKFLILPFIEILNMLDGYKKLKGKSVASIKGIDQKNKKYGKLFIGLSFLFYLVYGYFWNLFFLWRTLKHKSKNV